MTKGVVKGCLSEGEYLFVYNVKKGWDDENWVYSLAKIHIVYRKYVLFVRRADNSKWRV